MKKARKVIKIDEEKCTGCGLCIPNCPEGALQIIDGKVRLISDLFCDGLGACVGTCPEGALTIEERPAEPYDEKKVMENIVEAGTNTILAHLKHLKEHGAKKFYEEAIEYLKERNIPLPEEKPALACGCPGTQVRRLALKEKPTPSAIHPQSQLSTWPIQLTL
ncbi:MAG: 4Fe-4S binding protein, partial [bacterium]